MKLTVGDRILATFTVVLLAWALWSYSVLGL